MLEPLPTPRRPERPRAMFARNLAPGAALGWLRAGWDDFRADPWTSLAYGVFLIVLSYAVLWSLNFFGLLYLALPAMSGFLIVGPFLAIGLYEKSRRRMQGGRVGLSNMVLVRTASGPQLAYAGLFLGLLVLFWLRAADLLYALFFGLTPFPGAGDAMINVLMTPRGWALVLVGSAVGGLFAAFAFALSFVSVPMLLVERRDALTAMGMSFATTIQNLGPALVWGTIVAVGIGLSVITGLLGLAVIFPILGHGTWHAYHALHDKENAS